MIGPDWWKIWRQAHIAGVEWLRKQHELRLKIDPAYRAKMDNLNAEYDKIFTTNA